MILIVAVDKNWGIGKDNNLLYSVPEDMAFFKKTTTGKSILMGNNTLKSFKNQKPLPNRLNIVLTRKKIESQYDNLIYINNLNELKDFSQVILIGGASLYNQLYNKCEYAYITKIKKDEIKPDVFFPNLDILQNWEAEDIIEKGISKNGIEYEILKYKNKEVEALCN